MNSRVILFLPAVLSSVTIHYAAAITVYDPFLIGSTPSAGEYSTGPIGGQNPVINGVNGAWQGSTTTPGITASGLSYSNPSGTVLSSGGAVASASDATTTGRVGRLLNDPVIGSTIGTVYFSFMLQVPTVVSNYRAFELHQGTLNDTDRRLQIGVGQDLGSGRVPNFFIRLFNNNSSGFAADLGVINTDVNFFVGKFTLGANNNEDSLQLWLNPQDLSSEAGSTSVFFKDNFNMTFDRFSLARFTTGAAVPGAMTWDEIRFGTSWQAVTTVPEPSTFALAALGASALLLFRRRRQ